MSKSSSTSGQETASPTPSSQQEQIIKWFDKTYQNKGERYLRKVDAYRVFLSFLAINPADKLLDVACGLGRLLQAADDYKCQLTGVDISSVAVEKTKARLPHARVQQANAESLPFDDNSFSVITCLGSLERMLNQDSVLQELRRVGKADARYCILVRNSQTLIWKWFKQALGMRNAEGNQGAKSLIEWTELFKKNGFEVIDVIPDQYPLQRKKYLLSFGLKRPDPMAIIKNNKPIEGTGKFIFKLAKAKA
ncbi:class I SAM-dependent methyltransferase [Ningiella sp. W23]|uniref:class I SAM-dependent methyltransferase n=1 Tax=Ningiella sp. W23 TaxID=3023715 RepID=UPI003757065C